MVSHPPGGVKKETAKRLAFAAFPCLALARHTMPFSLFTIYRFTILKYVRAVMR